MGSLRQKHKVETSVQGATGTAAAGDEAGGMVWSAEGMSQDDFMLKDECIVLNYLDEVVGHDNKYNCHKFLPGQPKGILHRAFSVMLFDSEGKMLLQQRAASKITFPNVWTNTCCSHPLHGMRPAEVDSPAAVASGDPRGAKHAAVRKINHELGVPTSQLHAERFKFLTRVHYWAADVVTHGKEAPWGENEIDYLLLYQLQEGEKLDLSPHPDEVQAVRWVSRKELQEAMGDTGPLHQEMPLWSPWFRVIAKNFLDTWWSDLEAAMKTNKYLDVSTIHRFDPPPMHHGGAGNALPNLDALSAAETAAKPVDRRALALKAERDERLVALVGRGKKQSGSEGVKQGAYGKVITHKTSKLDQLMRVREVFAALRFKLANPLENNMPKDSEDVTFCDDMLGKVSRSFAAVIRQLPPGLCVDICIFYLVLRALDTVEDDMEAYKGREAEKQKELREFGAKRLSDESFSMDGVGEGDERVLLQRFGAVARVFNNLKPSSQAVIRDITDKMGAGMADYIHADLVQGTQDVAAYDLYCHHVAGLVGEGLTRMFVSEGGESGELSGQGERVWPFCPDVKKQPNNLGLANSMGLFLQKTNIIRDYLEDYVDSRAFWPQSIWRKHSITGDLGEFARPSAHGAGLRLKMKGPAGVVAAKGVGVQALRCLNELVADALELAPDSLEYLDRLHVPAIYRFCAIPQLMAMATLAECFDNAQVFTGVVKIRKGLTARLITACCDGPDAVLWWFAEMAHQLSSAVRKGTCTEPDGAIALRVAKACDRIEQRTGAARGRMCFCGKRQSAPGEDSSALRRRLL